MMVERGTFHWWTRELSVADDGKLWRRELSVADAGKLWRREFSVADCGKLWRRELSVANAGKSWSLCRPGRREEDVEESTIFRDFEVAAK